MVEARQAVGMVLALALYGCERKPAAPPAPATVSRATTTAKASVAPPTGSRLLSDETICAELRRSLGVLPSLKKAVSIEATLVVGDEIFKGESEVVRATSGSGLRIAGLTNLPSGTEFIVSLETELSNGATENVVVRGGCFVSPPLGDMALGSYKLVVSTMCLDVEPAQVQRVTGPNGERLKGPLVRKAKLCTTVEWSRDASVGASVAAASEADSARRDAVAKQKQKALQLAMQGAAMGPLRFGASLRNAKAGIECSERMSMLRAEVQRLRDDSSRDSSEASKPVRMQIMNLFDCVSCAAVADQACAKVQVALNAPSN